MNKEINNNLPLNIIDIFNALENNFSKIYTVDWQTKSITIYRYKNSNMNDEEFPKDVLPFEEEIKKYFKFIQNSSCKKELFFCTRDKGTHSGIAVYIRRCLAIPFQ